MWPPQLEVGLYAIQPVSTILSTIQLVGKISTRYPAATHRVPFSTLSRVPGLAEFVGILTDHLGFEPARRAEA